MSAKTHLTSSLIALAIAFHCPSARAQSGPVVGQPPVGTRQSVSDLDVQVAYQRAFEAVLWAMPASAIYRFRVGFLELPGMADNVIAAFSGTVKDVQEAITPNQVTPYICGTSDLRNGAVVLEVPAKTAKAVLYGQVVDAWQATIAEVGPIGPDKGAGGKYLFLPPGYSGPIPEGYFVVRSSSYRIVFCVSINPTRRCDGRRRSCLQPNAEDVPAFRGGQSKADPFLRWHTLRHPHAAALRHRGASRTSMTSSASSRSKRVTR